MDKIIVEIRGNKFTEEEIDSMLSDYINIGENIYKRRIKIVESLVKEFIKTYRKNGMNILIKKRNLKQFLNSAKLMYQLAEFYLCHNEESYNRYVYMLSKNIKGSKVYLHIKGNKELVIIYNSLFNFLDNWFIYKKVGNITFGK